MQVHLSWTVLTPQTQRGMLEIFHQGLEAVDLELSDILPLDRRGWAWSRITTREGDLFSILWVCDPDLTVECPWCMQSAANAFLVVLYAPSHFNVPLHLGHAAAGAPLQKLLRLFWWFQIERMIQLRSKRIAVTRLVETYDINLCNLRGGLFIFLCRSEVV